MSHRERDLGIVRTIIGGDVAYYRRLRREEDMELNQDGDKKSELFLGGTEVIADENVPGSLLVWLPSDHSDKELDSAMSVVAKTPFVGDNRFYTMMAIESIFSYVRWARKRIKRLEEDLAVERNPDEVAKKIDQARYRLMRTIDEAHEYISNQAEVARELLQIIKEAEDEGLVLGAQRRSGGAGV